MSDNPHNPDDDLTQPRVTLCDLTRCPFPDELLTRRFGFGGIPLTADETARCLKARRSLSGTTLERRTVECSRAPLTLPAGMHPAYPVRARRHVELLVEGRRVHIETIAQELGGPGGTNNEVRVYVDGVLEGRSILLGRLGGTVNTFPVVASIGEGMAMTVTPSSWTSLEELVIELWQRWRDPARER